MAFLQGPSARAWCWAPCLNLLVSSDSDFTRLASRLREGRHTVYGLGEAKTPPPFVPACDKYHLYRVAPRTRVRLEQQRYTGRSAFGKRQADPVDLISGIMISRVSQWTHGCHVQDAYFSTAVDLYHGLPEPDPTRRLQRSTRWPSLYVDRRPEAV
ncbi:NYN domain-containing protein [Pseudomonas fluorescens]|nr:NYN domain-containing protein [Pseudomonas fluorescens]NVH61694.1 NYN domain-containing protein [Pseudomonas simiae]TKK02622.1 NYN domain-containing protein [Pseudomonas fluorescens]